MSMTTKPARRGENKGSLPDLRRREAKPKHMPTPWRRDGSIISGNKHTAFLVGGKDAQHPTIFVESKCSTPCEVEQFEANVDLIILAVNAHARLFAKLNALISIKKDRRP